MNRRFVVARGFIQQEEAGITLFSMGRYIYRAWVTNLSSDGPQSCRRIRQPRLSSAALHADAGQKHS